MSDPFLGEIRIVGFNFAPTGWAQCNGQLLPISQNTALFSLLGTFYGGDGRSTFALPNLQGSAPMNQGQGPGLSLRDLGETGGESTVTLLQTEMPVHSHSLSGATQAADSTGDQASPANAYLARTGREHAYSAAGALNTSMGQLTDAAGGSQPHNNLSPYLVLNFIIAMQGIFPARS